MDNKNVFSELVIFIRVQINEYHHELTRTTLVESDLGVTGDEGEDFILAFSEKFNVNIDGFQFSKYFYDEPGVFNLPDRKIAPLSLGDLEYAIKVGRLNQETIKRYP